MESIDEHVLKSELTELKTAIKDFKSVIARCKKVPSISNYHKYYRSTIKKRCDEIKDKTLTKTQQLIRPGIGTDHNFNIYHFLKLRSHGSRIRIPIIDSLILSQNSSESTFIQNDLDGFISQQSGEEALSLFYNKLSLNGNQILPLCIFKPTDGKNILFDSIENVSEHMNTSKNLEGLLQKFIIGSGAHLSVLRVHWKGPNKLKAYMIGSKEKVNFDLTHKANLLKHQLSTHSSSKHLSRSYTEENLLKYAHNIIVQEEQKCAFSPMPELSMISSPPRFADPEPLHEKPSNSQASFIDILAARCVNPWGECKETSPYAIPNEIAQKFLVSGRNYLKSDVVELKKIFPEVVEAVNKIEYLLRNQFAKVKKKVLEFTLDFMKDHKQWVVLKCDKINIEEDFNNFKEVKGALNTHEAFSSIIPSLATQSINEPLSVQLKNIPSKRPESPLIHQRSISSTKIIPKKRFEAFKKRSSINSVQMKIQKFLDKTDKIVDMPEHNFNLNKSELIDYYAKNFLKCAINLKKEKQKSDLSMVTVNSAFKNDPSRAWFGQQMQDSSSLKSVIKDYNSMMIHVRRVNLKNKKKTIDFYGGDQFWNEFSMSFNRKVLTNERFTRYFARMKQYSFDQMFGLGMRAAFNSEITYELRRVVRVKHKGLNIGYDAFKAFSNAFLATLEEFGINKLDIEVIMDNLNSFSSAIVGSQKQKRVIL